MLKRQASEAQLERPVDFPNLRTFRPMNRPNLEMLSIVT